MVALKKVSLKRLDDGLPKEALREIKALQELNHENIVRLRELFPHGSGFVLVFDLMVTDLAEIIRDFERPLQIPHIKAYLQQILYGVTYMHSYHIMHRDLKPANLLISAENQLKIADFGQARLFFPGEGRPYSHQVATRWYRAPELLYGAKLYDQGVDLWSVGCIFGELMNNSPLFPGENDIEQLVYVFRVLGTPTEENWPGLTELPDYSKITFPDYPKVPFEKLVPEAGKDAINLLSRFLVYDSKKRISAEDALIHRFILSHPLASLADAPKPKPKSQKERFSLLDFDPCAPLNLHL